MLKNKILHRSMAFLLTLAVFLSLPFGVTAAESNDEYVYMRPTLNSPGVYNLQYKSPYEGAITLGKTSKLCDSYSPWFLKALECHFPAIA